MLKVIALHQGEMVIGSDPTTDIHIDSLAIQPRHASLTINGNEVILRDLATPDGTFVNGKRIEQEQAIADKDEIHIGKHDLVYDQGFVDPQETELEDHIPAKPVNDNNIQQPRQVAWLQLLSGNNVGKTIRINKRLTNLGTPGVQTAVIAQREEGYFLSHLEGERQPEVNGQAIGDTAHQLENGDVIRIGNVKIQFSLE